MGIESFKILHFLCFYVKVKFVTNKTMFLRNFCISKDSAHSILTLMGKPLAAFSFADFKFCARENVFINGYILDAFYASATSNDFIAE
jgi:hypothetical protein